MFKTVGKLKLELIEEKQATTETARAEPIWGGHLIEMTPSMIKKQEVWKNILQLNKVGDSVKNRRNPMDNGGSQAGTNPGEPEVGIQWISHDHKMQGKKIAWRLSSKNMRT